MHLNITLPFLSRYPGDPFVRRFITKFSYALIGSHHPKFKLSLPYIPRCHCCNRTCVCINLQVILEQQLYSNVSSNSNGNSKSTVVVIVVLVVNVMSGLSILARA